MRPLMLRIMMSPLRSAVLRACAPLVLAAPLLAGCGGAKAAGSPAYDTDTGASPAGSADAQASFVRVGEVRAASSTPLSPPPPAPTVTATPSADPESPLPTLGAEAHARGGTHEHKTDKEKGVHGAVVDSSGALSEAEVRATIVQQQFVFRQCYEVGMASAPGGFAGVVSLRASIGPAGTVSTVDVVESTTKNQKVDLCVAEAVRRIQFPARGGSATVGFPIEFGR